MYPHRLENFISAQLNAMRASQPHGRSEVLGIKVSPCRTCGDRGRDKNEEPCASCLTISALHGDVEMHVEATAFCGLQDWRARTKANTKAKWLDLVNRARPLRDKGLCWREIEKQLGLGAGSSLPAYYVKLLPDAPKFGPGRGGGKKNGERKP